MDLNNLIAPVLSLGGLGIIFGALLGYASKKFAVEVDPRVPQVRDALPGANCGGCGFAGCDAYADAVVNAGASPSGCPVGGAACASKIAEIMGVTVDTSEPKKAYVKCQGTCNNAKEKYEYYGAMTCVDAANIPGAGSKQCSYGCMGLGSCTQVCLFDAITIEGGIAVIDEEKCTGCGACVDICPKAVIELTPMSKKVRIACNSHDKGISVKNSCAVGCISCGLCARNCPVEAIEMVDNLPVINYDKCVQCGICVKKCPTKAIANLKKDQKVAPKAKPVAEAKPATEVKEATKPVAKVKETKDDTKPAAEVKEAKKTEDK
ncbi:RnfABCDGE type electron transport complex subunit B [Clostridium tetani]|uniref:RnfABCDGE type electron transport complex subunit B n=1 Tax=Clostridium tetani TaxID=1513 RepID=UPI0006280471|nr:Fe-S cluster domain-containing protein [Clostridium tetani]BDR86331.1 ferredoxin [Clostridium tetani]